MYRTLFFMALAVIVTVFAALVSNDFSQKPQILAAARVSLPGPVSEALPALQAEQAGQAEQAELAGQPEIPEPPQAAADESVTLPQKHAAALLFMGVLRDN